MLAIIPFLVLHYSGFVQEDPPSRLPIDVPKKALVGFEAEGTGREFVPILKRLLSPDPLDFRNSQPSKIEVKTPFGSINLSIDDLAPLLEEVRYLHLVTYSGGAKEDPFKAQEKRLGDLGMKRVVLAPGSDGPLIMRKTGRSEQYGIVAKNKGNIIVLRTEGGPNLGDFGQVVYETLAKLIQQHPPRKH